MKSKLFTILGSLVILSSMAFDASASRTPRSGRCVRRPCPPRSSVNPRPRVVPRVRRHSSRHRVPSLFERRRRPSIFWGLFGSPYRRYSHRPHISSRSHNRRYYSQWDFQSTMFNFLVGNWIFYSVSWSNGYHFRDDYPWMVYNGHRHRYSPIDRCSYELVDSFSDLVVETYGGMICRDGYDLCAHNRDNWNYEERENRYFCAERYSGR